MMSERPWISVVMPTYNGADFIRPALDSIVSQQDPGIECIVVDDGSTDDTVPIAGTYQDRLRLVIRKNPHSGNWVRRTNEGLKAANGEYISFLHQDDEWLDERLAVLRNLASGLPRISLFLGAAYFIEARGARVGAWHCPLPAWPEPLDRNLLIRRLLVQNFIAIPAPMFKRELALEVGGMDESAWYTADWDFWLKLAARAKSVYHSHPTVGFRIHRHSQTYVRSSAQAEFRAQHAAVAERHLAAWGVPEREKRRVRSIASFSMDVNAALSAAMHGSRRDLGGLIGKFVALGPSGQYAYLRDSRIWERASARIRAGLG